MPAYVIARVKIDDLETYKKYAAKSMAAVEKSGGRFMARGGETQMLEGEDDVDRVVIIEFQDMESARNWYNSEQYQQAKLIRSPISVATFTLVDGL